MKIYSRYKRDRNAYGYEDECNFGYGYGISKGDGYGDGYGYGYGNGYGNRNGNGDGNGYYPIKQISMRIL